MKKIFLLVILSFVFFNCRYVQDAQDTAFKELKASSLLKKYEWFKDASAQLDKKIADIKVYEARINSLNESYSGKSRNEWAREDREQWSIWQSEFAGIKASYNSLAAEYNSQMAKFNWQFCNVGTLPKGATDPLPREFKPYVTD